VPGEGGATGFQRRHLTHGYCGAALKRRWSPRAVKECVTGRAVKTPSPPCRSALGASVTVER
jgi:hypothetical protein